MEGMQESSTTNSPTTDGDQQILLPTIEPLLVLTKRRIANADFEVGPMQIRNELMSDPLEPYQLAPLLTS
jgi:hypothetical protein